MADAWPNGAQAEGQAGTAARAASCTVHRRWWSHLPQLVLCSRALCIVYPLQPHDFVRFEAARGALKDEVHTLPDREDCGAVLRHLQPAPAETDQRLKVELELQVAQIILAVRPRPDKCDALASQECTKSAPALRAAW
eukprot:5656163-Pleurochrysis_carterae.AAC.1